MSTGSRDYSAWVGPKPARIDASLLERCLAFD